MMKEGLPPIDTPTGYGHLLGTRWRNKRGVRVYRVTEIGGAGTVRDGMVLLASEANLTTRWKYAPHLPFDYEEIKDGTNT